MRRGDSGCGAGHSCAPENLRGLHRTSLRRAIALAYRGVHAGAATRPIRRFPLDKPTRTGRLFRRRVSLSAIAERTIRPVVSSHMDDSDALENLRGPSDLQGAWRDANAALVESERRYRELVEHSLGLICTHDLSGHILSVNPAAASSLGFRPDEGIGQRISDFLAPEARHLFDPYLQRIQQNGRDAGLMSLVSRSGDVRIWMYSNVLSRASDGTAYVLGHAIDISDRIAAERAVKDREDALRAAQAELEERVRARTLELERANERLHREIAEREDAQRAREHALREAEQANRTKDEFLGTLSHELRTPLHAIFGWARILRSRRLEADVAHGVEVIERNAQAQIRLIDELLDLSRIVAGKMTLAREDVDVAATLRSTLETVRPSFEARAIRCEEHIAVDLPNVLGDAARVQQVLANLLSNALKFTPPGGTISITLRRIGDVVEAAISDTGIGIRRDVLPFVFDRFRQADASMTRSHGGLGLGLAIVKHIVSLHDGSVEATSAGEGQGATFTVRLPVVERRADAGPANLPGRVAGASRPALGGWHLLVVEDHQDAREIVCEVLRAAGGDVLGAATTSEALAMAETTKPDVLVADLGLPGEDGFTLLRELRVRYPGLPAIALTAYARSTDRERVIAAGFQQYVTKPVDPEELVHAIAQLRSAVDDSPRDARA